MTGTGRQQAKQLYVKVGYKSANIKAKITTFIAIFFFFSKHWVLNSYWCRMTVKTWYFLASKFFAPVHAVKSIGQ